MIKEKIRIFFNTVIGNKYLLTVFLFLLWIGFLDPDNLYERAANKRELQKFKQEIDKYHKQIEEDKFILEQIKQPDFLEKFAREEYFMKKENEDIFIIVDE